MSVPQPLGVRKPWERVGMKRRTRLWESLGDITEEIEFEMHECYPLHRARWRGISVLLRRREDAAICIRSEVDALSNLEQIALLGRHSR